jgi:intracellular septation protein A
MIDTRRRTILKLLGGISLSVTLPLYWKTRINSEIQHELQVALTVWNKHEIISPQLFIEQKKITMMSVFDLEQQIVNEFKILNTMDVNGLILSQTETALLAAIASQ